MISGYIIEKYSNMQGAYTCNRLIEEAQRENVDLQLVGIHDTVVDNSGIYTSGKRVDKRDFVINRYKTGKIKDEINSLVFRSYNELNGFCSYVNKFEQIKKIHSNSFYMPKTILATYGINYKYVTELLGSPFVAKGLESSMGQEIYLIKTEKDFLRLLNGNEEKKEWLLEEFISSSFGRDIRVFSIKGKPEACMIRKSSSDFRANVALGASVQGIEATSEIKKIADDIYMQTKLDFVGIDLLFGENRLCFCEINVMPGLEGIEAATKINIANKIIRTIKSDLRNE